MVGMPGEKVSNMAPPTLALPCHGPWLVGAVELLRKPGTRLVMNTFAIPEWDADVTETISGSCVSWCTSLLYFVPAQVAGTWKLPQGQLTLTQTFQKVSGTLTRSGKTVPIANGKLRGDQITFSVEGTEYSGRVAADRIDGVQVTGGTKQTWTASRAPN